jgi:hypothetical protein
MTSSSFDIREFGAAVKDKGYWEVLCLAEREALDAWRTLHKQGQKGLEGAGGLDHCARRVVTFRCSPVFIREVELERMRESAAQATGD